MTTSIAWVQNPDGSPGSAVIESGDLFSETDAFSANLIAQMSSGGAAFVTRKQRDQSRLVSLRDQVGQHPLAEQRCPVAGDLRPPLGFEHRLAPSGPSAPQVGMVIQASGSPADHAGDPVNGLPIGHRPNNGRIEGSEPVGSGHEDCAVAIGEARQICHGGLFQQRDWVGRFLSIPVGTVEEVEFVTSHRFGLTLNIRKRFVHTSVYHRYTHSATRCKR